MFYNTSPFQPSDEWQRPNYKLSRADIIEHKNGDLNYVQAVEEVLLAETDGIAGNGVEADLCALNDRPWNIHDDTPEGIAKDEALSQTMNDLIDNKSRQRALREAPTTTPTPRSPIVSNLFQPQNLRQ